MMKTKVSMLVIAVAVAAGVNAQTKEPKKVDIAPNQELHKDYQDLKKDNGDTHANKEKIDKEGADIHKDNKAIGRDVHAINKDWIKIKQDQKSGNKAALAGDYAKLKKDKDDYNRVDAESHKDERTMQKYNSQFDKDLQDRNKDFQDIRKDKH
ncbi:hypothetical protein [Segetibacter koreensis]|uniref:hypothetical protein n=1 Tax=Segetibacter koreensis TaxID=398037 RepID=UPI000527E419|nr:hypothetical protein [Segetibacter koreensis]